MERINDRRRLVNFMHVGNFVRNFFMNRPRLDFFYFFIFYCSISDEASSFGLFKGVIKSILFSLVIVRSSVKHDFFIKLLFVYFQIIFMLSFELHLQLSISFVNSI